MICQIEGKKKQLDIAQVKEVLKILIDNICDNERLGFTLETNNEIAFQFIKIIELKDAAIKQKALAKNKNKRKK